MYSTGDLEVLKNESFSVWIETTILIFIYPVRRWNVSVARIPYTMILERQQSFVKLSEIVGVSRGENREVFFPPHLPPLTSPHKKSGRVEILEGRGKQVFF